MKASLLHEFSEREAKMNWLGSAPAKIYDLVAAFAFLVIFYIRFDKFVILKGGGGAGAGAGGVGRGWSRCGAGVGAGAYI